MMYLMKTEGEFEPEKRWSLQNFSTEEIEQDYCCYFGRDFENKTTHSETSLPLKMQACAHHKHCHYLLLMFWSSLQQQLQQHIAVAFEAELFVVAAAADFAAVDAENHTCLQCPSKMA